MGVGDEKTHHDLNLFFKEKKIYPDLVKIDIEGGEVNVIKYFIKNTFKCTIFLEVHPLAIKNHFNGSTEELIELIFDNFNRIEFNRNHWGSFKGIPSGSWEEAKKEHIIKLAKDIEDGKSKPNGFGLIIK